MGILVPSTHSSFLPSFLRSFFAQLHPPTTPARPGAYLLAQQPVLALNLGVRGRHGARAAGCAARSSGRRRTRPVNALPPSSKTKTKPQHLSGFLAARRRTRIVKEKKNDEKSESTSGFAGTGAWPRRRYAWCCACACMHMPPVALQLPLVSALFFGFAANSDVTKN